jgi:Iron-containing redox enzyme
MRPPQPRGPVSAAVRAALVSESGDEFLSVELPNDPEDIFRDDDLQLALWMLYEQSYRAFEDAHDHEWDPAAVAVRRRLERPFEKQLRTATAPVVADSLEISDDDVVSQIEHTIGHAPGPDLARFLHREATRDQVLDFLAQRSVYHLKESDPHSFVVGRVGGPAKVALAELQYDEFGAGRPERLHSHMYAVALDAAGLDPEFGAYIERVPATTLAVNNLMSLLGLSHRLRGAALGHLAAFESTSSVPCRRIAAGIERVGLPEATAAYFHEHVEADAAHEQIVLRDICRNFVESEPTQRAEVLFGVAACLYLDALAAEDLLDSWAPSDTGELAS